MTNKEIVEYRVKILQAVLDNKAVQYRFSNRDVSDKWCDALDLEMSIPNFTLYEYRIKPTPVRYKVGLFNSGSDCYPSLIPERSVEVCATEGRGFIRWLTDWIEYEAKP